MRPSRTEAWTRPRVYVSGRPVKADGSVKGVRGACSAERCDTFVGWKVSRNGARTLYRWCGEHEIREGVPVQVGHRQLDRSEVDTLGEGPFPEVQDNRCDHNDCCLVLHPTNGQAYGLCNECHSLIEGPFDPLGAGNVLAGHLVNLVCAVCASPHNVERHHFAPRHLFGWDAESWPKAYLCRPCHMRWHRKVTPEMWRRNRSTA